MHFPLLSTQQALDIKIVFYNAVELGSHSSPYNIISPGDIITTQKKKALLWVTRQYGTKVLIHLQPHSSYSFLLSFPLHCNGVEI